MSTVNLVSVSGGKDSTATLLLALERGVENIQAVFADTGNEHELTYEYVDYLQRVTGVKINQVKADFTKQIERKRKRFINYLIAFDSAKTHDRFASGYVYETLLDGLELLKPTGIPFLDLCIWKGKFPSTKSRFCTDELKVQPIIDQLIWPLLHEYDSIESWQGIRWDESKVRSTYVEREGIEPDAQRVFAYRPILSWTVEEVFAFHRKYGVDHNPLYVQGMGRVGCMPCVNCNKDELRQIALRFPDVVERIKKWETRVSKTSRRGSSTFFTVVSIQGLASDEKIHHSTHGIDQKVQWSKTVRGGVQYDLIPHDMSACSSIYGLCG